MDDTHSHPPHTASLAWFKEQTERLAPQSEFYREYATQVEKMCAKAITKSDNPVIPFLSSVPYLHEVVRPAFKTDGSLDAERTLLVDLPAWLDDMAWQKQNFRRTDPLHPNEKVHYLLHTNMYQRHTRLAKTPSLQQMTDEALAASSLHERSKKEVLRRIAHAARGLTSNSERAYDASNPFMSDHGSHPLLFAPHRLFIEGVSQAASPQEGNPLDHLAPESWRKPEIDNLIRQKIEAVVRKQPTPPHARKIQHARKASSLTDVEFEPDLPLYMDTDWQPKSGSANFGFRERETPAEIDDDSLLGKKGFVR